MPVAIDLRHEARRAFDAAVAAVQPSRLLAGTGGGCGAAVHVAGLEVPRPHGRRVVAAIGKAAPGLAEAWRSRAPGWATETFVLAPHDVPVPAALAGWAAVRRGAHPTPDRAGAAAARELLDLAAGLGPEDALVVLLSGGSSALLAAPVAGVTLEHLAAITSGLLRSGAPIGELNAVRRALLAAAGGGLARAARPASVVTLLLSDVVDGTLADVGSGPTLPSPTGASEALAVCERRGVELPDEVREALRRAAPAPAGGSPVGRLALLANNRTAVDAAAAELERRGFRVVTAGRALTGEAAERGRQLGALAAALHDRSPAAVVLGGETTVTVRGPGRGGRCQELALAAALALAGRSGRVVLAAATDGVDGATRAAGAVVDGGTVARIVAAGVRPERALEANDSGPALAASGDQMVTGATGTNVADLVAVLAGPT